jgi:HD-GYP domain-containing protein (c-di-GMP phosphodiesterase class II)
MLVVFVKNFGTGTKEENKEFIEKIVEDALVYLRGLKKDEDITFAYKEFFDLVSAVSFFDNGQNGFDLYLNLLKIQDVPTYVHSIGVAEITKALTKSLLESNPQEFIGINNQYNTLDEVLNNKDQIIDLLYRGALLHDIGKTPLVDVISNCYRPLTDQEFILIKSHPAFSESIISDVFGSCIQDVAMFHHLSHDHKSGYPKVNDNFKSKNQIAIDILSVADTLEAATDNIGRTYKKSKTVEQIIVEMNSYPKDTRYSSLVLSAIKGETFNRIMTYLNVDRIKIYCKSIRELYDNTLIKMSDIKI